DLLVPGSGGGRRRTGWWSATLPEHRVDCLVGGATVADDGDGVVDTVGAAGIAAARAARVDEGCPVPLLPEDRYRGALRCARSTPGVDLRADGEGTRRGGVVDVPVPIAVRVQVPGLPRQREVRAEAA